MCCKCKAFIGKYGLNTSAHFKIELKDLNNRSLKQLP